MEYIGGDARALPLADASVDHVVGVLRCAVSPPWTGHWLAEIRRVLRPAGAFHFMEHGLSLQETVTRW